MVLSLFLQGHAEINPILFSLAISSSPLCTLLNLNNSIPFCRKTTSCTTCCPANLVSKYCGFTIDINRFGVFRGTSFTILPNLMSIALLLVTTYLFAHLSPKYSTRLRTMNITPIAAKNTVNRKIIPSIISPIVAFLLNLLRGNSSQIICSPISNFINIITE
ncbi:hypothetical protein STK_26240 [Sulfurisphaera tokodaii str. 7]|uniref:Uncharacterized protein n=1 Tax=Sulfurisphaera tokodaii (strain DSM 16993 / JCM 10545 / NBRC 100140 / 7) TaxID=273063 RepID=Q96X86_SULTO|nr:hypothetical protein STK_26240 [Sulfurisphaera tokodaii str. 7]